MFCHTIIILSIIILNFSLRINTQHLPLCESLKNNIEDNEINKNNLDIKLRRIRAICDAVYSSQANSKNDELDLIPDFDLTKITSNDEAEQILKRYRRRGGRGGGGGGGRGGGGRSGGGRFGGSRFGGSRSGGRFSSSFSRSSSSGSRIFSRSSSSSGGSSRIFSRSSSSSSGGSSRIFSRSGSSSGSTGHRVREAIRSIGKPSSSGTGAGGSSKLSNTGTSHRVREAVRTMFRHSPGTNPSGVSSATGGIAGAAGSKPGLSDKIRQITHGGGTSGRFSSGSFGSGGNSWVRTGKTFMPTAVRFGKRYYQRRKYNQGLYAGAGYYAGSHMGGHYHYPYGHYGYPPVVDKPPEIINGRAPTVFYCLQEDLNKTLVNTTLDSEGLGICNVSGKLVTCPVEIECQMEEADNCCEDEQGTPYCCGGPIPEEYFTQYGGYSDMYGTAESLHKILNIITAMSVVLATICFTMWHRRGQ